MPIAFLRFEVPNHYAQHPLLFLAEDMLFKVKVSAILALFSFPWISSIYAMLCYAMLSHFSRPGAAPFEPWILQTESLCLSGHR